MSSIIDLLPQEILNLIVRYSAMISPLTYHELILSNSAFYASVNEIEREKIKKSFLEKFSFTVNHEGTFVLSYSSQDVLLELCPENPSPIEMANIGAFESPTYNGCCSLHWEPRRYIFSLAKYGDGHGGSMTVRITNTPELKESFEEAIKKWNMALQTRF